MTGEADIRDAFAGINTPAGRMQFVMDLYAPLVEQEDGTWARDPEIGLIDKNTAMELLTWDGK